MLMKLRKKNTSRVSRLVDSKDIFVFKILIVKLFTSLNYYRAFQPKFLDSSVLGSSQFSILSQWGKTTLEKCLQMIKVFGCWSRIFFFKKTGRRVIWVERSTEIRFWFLVPVPARFSISVPARISVQK